MSQTFHAASLWQNKKDDSRITGRRCGVRGGYGECADEIGKCVVDGWDLCDDVVMRRYYNMQHAM